MIKIKHKQINTFCKKIKSNKSYLFLFSHLQQILKLLPLVLELLKYAASWKHIETNMAKSEMQL